MRFHITALAAAMALAAGTALAQSRPKPDDPKVPAPPLEYRSAYEGYRAYSEAPLTPWRDVNDEVARVGGHTGVMRAEDTKAPAAGTPTPPQPGKAPAAHDQKH